MLLRPIGIKTELYTTSDIIAEHTGHTYRSIQRTIENQMERLEHFGIMRFQFTLSGNAGRPQKVYFLNEEQATLLITFLKNTSVVADFKVSLVAAFYAMRQELTRRKELRTEGKPMCGGDPDGKVHLLLEYAGRPGAEVADPWYTRDFEATWRDVQEGCKGLLEQILSGHV